MRQNWGEVIVLTDSQAALQAIASPEIKLRTVWDCVRDLNRACDRRKVTVCWIKAHAGYPGNERADQLAKIGAVNAQPGIITLASCAKSPAQVRNTCRGLLYDKWTLAWQGEPTCRQTKQWFPKASIDHVRGILSLDRETISVVVQMLTGHNYLRRHNVIVGDAEDDQCRLCMEDEESSFHIIAECPALATARRTTFGTHCLVQPLEWSHQVLMFLRGQTIGHLIGLGEEGQVLDEEHPLVAGEEEQNC